jgi:hypothetical protein
LTNAKFPARFVFAHWGSPLRLLSAFAAHADRFVITATEDSKDIAQKKAAETGGWVLDTNLYTGLTSREGTRERM